MSDAPAWDDDGAPHRAVAPPPGNVPFEFVRSHRIRLFRAVPERFYEVWDSLQVPFEAPGFPRDELVYEAVAADRGKLIDGVLSRERTIGVRPGQRRVEILRSPAEVWRCRLYLVAAIRTVPDRPCRHVEVWDTTAEPCEYRHAMPEGELLATAQDFSRLQVWRTVAARKQELGILLSTVWKLHALA